LSSTPYVNDFESTFKLFDGCFDAADIGQFLFGDDPRNQRGVKILRRELTSSYLKAREFNYTYSKNRAFIDIGSNPKVRLFNLHIHSKNAKIFSPKTGTKELIDGVKNQSKPEKRVFVGLVFLNSLKVAAMRRGLNVIKVVRNA
jgi:hypothetical protein